MPDNQRIEQLRTKHREFHASIRGLSGKALMEQKPALVGEIRKLSDSVNGRDDKQFTAEESARWETVNEHYDLLDAELVEAANPQSTRNHRDRLAALESGLKQTAGGIIPGRENYTPSRHQVGDGPGAEVTEAIRARALNAWVRAQMGEYVEEADLEACRAARLNPNAKALNIPLLNTEGMAEARALCDRVHPTQLKKAMGGLDYRANLSQQVGGSGAYLVPPETLVRELETNLLWYGAMRQVAETMVTTSGERMSWPTADDTTNVGAQLGENTSIGSSTDPTFGKVYWDAYKWSSKPVLVPYELLEDSVFNLVPWLGQALGIRIGRITNTRYTTGTGAATPKGIITAASSFSAAGSSSIAFDDIFGLIHSIDVAYRTADCGFMMHDTIILTIRKLKDSQGRYLWEPGLQIGVPDRVLSYRFTTNNDMDSTISSGKKTVLFGQLFKYKIRRAGGMRIYRLQERYRDSDQDGFIAFVREDGNLLTAGTAPVKYLSH
jgi:HK97 family phage major capsid protein